MRVCDWFDARVTDGAFAAFAFVVLVLLVAWELRARRQP